MDQRRRLPRVIRALVAKVAGGPPPPLAANQRHEIVSRVDVAAPPGAKEIAEELRR